MNGETTCLVSELLDGDVFSVDDGARWHVCAVLGFGTVSVYVDDTRTDDSPTVRVPAERESVCRVRLPRGTARVNPFNELGGTGGDSA